MRVFLGLARAYFLAGGINAKLPSPLVHVHAAVATLWISLLTIQVALITSRRIAWHRQLGMFGAALVMAMVVLALLTATQSFARGFSPPRSESPPLHFTPSQYSVVGLFEICAGPDVGVIETIPGWLGDERDSTASVSGNKRRALFRDAIDIGRRKLPMPVQLLRRVRLVVCVDRDLL
jgi:hypothetical protein